MRADNVRRGAAATTSVALEFLEGERNYRLLFGDPLSEFESEHHFGVTKRTVHFRAGQIFALELWDGSMVLNRSKNLVPRTRAWRILVLEAGRATDLVSHVPHVDPGAHVLLEGYGTRACGFLKPWIKELLERSNPALLPREFYLARDLRLRALWHTAPARALTPRLVGDAR